MGKKFNDKQAMIESKEWLGKFVAFHQIGEYSFVEYKPKVYKDNTPKIPKEYQKQSHFSPFINGEDISVSYNSIEGAMVGAIAYRYDGANTRADNYFMKAISHPTAKDL